MFFAAVGGLRYNLLHGGQPLYFKRNAVALVVSDVTYVGVNSLLIIDVETLEPALIQGLSTADMCLGIGRRQFVVS